jgi:hypothetical protein
MMMRAALLLLLLAYLASPARADWIDDLCTREASHPKGFTPLTDGLRTYLYAACSDAELRALARKRKQAYDEANARLDPLGQQALMAEEAAGGVGSYASACGITPNVPLVLPLAPKIKHCMVRAVEASIAHLGAYSAPAISGPSFDERIASLRPGQTTQAQAMALLGTPVGGIKVPEGELVGWTIGSKAVTVLFGHDGNMIKVTVDSMMATPGGR